jgi:ABC-type glycerol-3-phosphate transport system substrate-binding protein
MAVTISDFAQAGLLLPFDDAQLQKFIIPDGAKMDGKSWTIPSGSQIIPLVYYNKAIFEKAGVKPPTNYQELVDVAQKLKDAGETPIMMCGAEPWCGSFPVVALVSADVFGSNPDWMKQRKEGKVKFSDPEMVAAFQKFQDLVKSGAIDPNGLGMDFQTANQAFYDGKAAMYLQGSWFIGYMTPEVSANTGVFLWPRDDGKAIAPFYAGGGVRVSSKTQYPELAKEFGYCLETYDQTANIEKDALFPMTKGKAIEDYGVTVSPLYMEAYNGYVLNNDVPKFSSFTWSNNDDDVIAGMKDEIYKSIQNVFLGADVKTEMERLDKAWENAEKAIQK